MEVARYSYIAGPVFYISDVVNPIKTQAGFFVMEVVELCFNFEQSTVFPSELMV